MSAIASRPKSLAASLVLATALAACGGTAAPMPSTFTDAVIKRTASHSSCTWSIVKSPNKGAKLGDSNILSAVSMRNGSDVWAAGDFYDYKHSLYHTLAEHYDGMSWQISPTLDAGTEQSEFFGITTAGTTDAWAVGYSQQTNPEGPYYTLIEHWNGYEWSIAQSDYQLGVLNAAAATGPNDVWAVGTENYPGPGVIEHWDGSHWTYTELKMSADLRSVAALAPNDVWAVGYQSTGSRGDKTLTLHYDGTRWHRVKSPSPLHIHYEDQNWLTIVAPIASNDVWALGVTRDTDYGILDQPLSLHWNGKKWRLVPFPPPGGSKQYNSVWGGTALAANDVWAVGQVGVDTFQTMTVQWNGKAWSQVQTPPRKTANLWGAAPDGTGGLWSVGETAIKKYVTGTLIMRCM